MNKSTPPKGYRVEKVGPRFGAYLETKPLDPIAMEDTRAKAVVACWEHRAKPS